MIDFEGAVIVLAILFGIIFTFLAKANLSDRGIQNWWRTIFLPWSEKENYTQKGWLYRRLAFWSLPVGVVLLFLGRIIRNLFL